MRLTRVSRNVFCNPALSPASRAQLIWGALILGLTPQALCWRPLRGLRADSSRLVGDRVSRKKREGLRMLRTLSPNPSPNGRGEIVRASRSMRTGMSAYAAHPLPWPLSQWERGRMRTRRARSNSYGTIFVAGSLQGLWPLALTAATRNQTRVTDGKTRIVKVDLVGTA